MFKKHNSTERFNRILQSILIVTFFIFKQKNDRSNECNISKFKSQIKKKMQGAFPLS